MKNKILGILVCMLLILTFFSTVGAINFDKNQYSNKTSNQSPSTEKGQTYYKKSFADIAYSVTQTDDEEIIADGTSIPEEALRLCMIKTDKDGNKEWFKTYGEDNSHSYAAYDVEQTPDGDFVHAGSTTATSDGHEDCLLIKTDKNGNMIWNNTYGGLEDQVAYDVEVTDDGGYFVVGYTTDTTDGHQDVYFFKTDEDGNLEFEVQPPMDTTNYGFSGEQTLDGDYIVCGITDVTSDGKYDCWLLKFNSSGVELWNKTYGGLEDQVAYDVEVTKDEGYIIAGYTNDTYNGEPDILLIKTNKNGDMEWTKKYGYQEDFVKIEISAGLGITASIENIGTETLTDVNWSLTVNNIEFGLVLFGEEKTGNIPILEPGNIETVKSLIIGAALLEIKLLIQYRDLDDDGLANIILIVIFCIEIS